MVRLFSVLALMTLLLAACGGGDSGGDNGNDENAGSGESQSGIYWERSRTHVVFRADVVSADSEEDFFARSEIPPCTIYGDGRVVWNTQSENPAEGVRVGPVDDQRIRNFVERQTVARNIYSYDARADLQGDTVQPVVRTLTIHVSGREHVTDSYADWEDGYYEDVLEECRNLSPRPQVYEPKGAWLRVREEPYNPQRPSVIWEPDVTQLDLDEIAEDGEPVWVTGQVLRILWAYRERSPIDLQFGQQSGNFLIALEIPGVTRHSRPAPEDADLG